MTDRKTMQERTEEAISDARGLFNAMYDEDAPDITDSLTRNSVKKRTDEGMHRLDTASAVLQEFGFAFHHMMDERDEAKEEVERLEQQVKAASFLHLADALEYELEGRIITDSPESVLAWVREAFAEVRRHNDPEDEDEATAIIYSATNLFAGVAS